MGTWIKEGKGDFMVVKEVSFYLKLLPVSNGQIG